MITSRSARFIDHVTFSTASRTKAPTTHIKSVDISCGTADCSQMSPGPAVAIPALSSRLVDWQPRDERPAIATVSARVSAESPSSADSPLLRSQPFPLEHGQDAHLLLAPVVDRKSAQQRGIPVHGELHLAARVAPDEDGNAALFKPTVITIAAGAFITNCTEWDMEVHMEGGLSASKL